MKKLFLTIMSILALSISGTSRTYACTSILVSKGASIDGSVIITYSNDGAVEWLPHLSYTPAKDHVPDEYIELRDGNGHVHKIKQVAHTYAVVGLMNEFQVSIGETTFGGRPELQSPDGAINYEPLMKLAL